MSSSGYFNMSSSGINPEATTTSATTNMSSSGMNPEVTTASPSELPLWGVFLLVIVGVMVISSVFLIAVLLHNIQKRKNVRYVYQTKPVKSDKKRNASVYSIRGQGILELNSPNPKHHNYMNVWDESGNRPQEEQSEELVNQTLPTSEGAATGESNRQELEDTNPDVVYESISSSSEDIGGGFERNSITRQSIRSDAGRSIHVTHQNNFRMSVRSEAGMSRGIQRDSEGSGSARGIGVGVRIHRGNTDPAFSLPTNNNLEEGEDLQNSDPGMLPLSIHQIHPPKAAPLEKKASGAQLIAPGIIFTSSPISEIPGFKDPEILGAGASDSLEQLKIDIPPDIYSSQILRTVRSPEPESETHAEEELENQFFESGPVIITQTRKSTASLDRFLSLDPAESSGNAGFDDPHYTRVELLGADEDDDDCDDEVVYDKPHIVKSLDQLPLFDDPGYDKGPLKHHHSADGDQTSLQADMEPSGASKDQVSVKKEEGRHVYHTLDLPQAVGGSVHRGGSEEGDGISQGREEESLAVLGYLEDELQEFESCLL